MKTTSSWRPACLLFALATLFCLSTSAQTQADINWYKEYKAYPYAFVSVQGGAQTTLADGMRASRLFTPIAAISVGYQFTPYIGLRANFSEWNNKGYYKPLGQKYSYKYINYDLDLMLNVWQWLFSSSYKKTNVFLIGGIGLNQGLSNKTMRGWVESGQNPSTYPWRRHAFYNVRMGVLLEHNLTRHLAVNIEATANNVADRYNSIANAHGDWQIQVLCGLTIKFGHKKNPYHDPNYGVADTPELQFEEVGSGETVETVTEVVEEEASEDDEEEEETDGEATPAN